MLYRRCLPQALTIASRSIRVRSTEAVFTAYLVLPTVYLSIDQWVMSRRTQGPIRDRETVPLVPPRDVIRRAGVGQ